MQRIFLRRPGRHRVNPGRRAQVRHSHSAQLRVPLRIFLLSIPDKPNEFSIVCRRTSLKIFASKRRSKRTNRTDDGSVDLYYGQTTVGSFVRAPILGPRSLVAKFSPNQCGTKPRKASSVVCHKQSLPQARPSFTR